MAAYRSRVRGFTLVEILIVILIIGVLLAIALPNFINARTRSYATTCQSNLRAIQSAKTQWVGDTKPAAGVVPTFADLVGPNKYFKSEPVCPAGGTYSVNGQNEDPTCTLTNIPGHVLP